MRIPLASKMPGVFGWADGIAMRVGRFVTLPTASVAHRGALARVEGASGVADRLRVARKTTANTYEWAYIPTLTDDAALYQIGGITGVQGDILYHTGTSWARLPKGTAGQRLVINAGATAPEWQTPVATMETGTITISGDAVTIPEAASYIANISLIVDTQGGAASDNLDTINVTGTVAVGTILRVMIINASRNVVLINNSGNLRHPNSIGNITLDTLLDSVVYMRVGTLWRYMSHGV